MEKLVQIEKVGAVAILRLNRPERQNAMNRRMVECLNIALSAVEQDESVRALVVTGTGKAFSSGFDLKEQAQTRPHGVATWQEILALYSSTIMRFWHCDKPTVAAVNGSCMAGGFELALACDMTIAGEDAVFGEPELRFGAGIVVMLLPWLVNSKRAKEIILLGEDRIAAAEALAMGLVNKVVPPSEVLSKAVEIARRLAVIDPTLMHLTKRAINRTYETMGIDMAIANSVDIDVQIEAEGTAEKHEFLDIVRDHGMRTALEWREQRFATAPKGIGDK